MNGNTKYALKWGVTVRAVRAAGGSEHLLALDPSIRKLKTKPYMGHQPSKEQLIRRRKIAAKKLMRKAGKMDKLTASILHPKPAAVVKPTK